MNKLMHSLFLAIVFILLFTSCKKDIGNSSPTIEFITPKTSFSILNDTEIVVSVKVSDANDFVTKVEFYIDETLFSSNDSPPYTFIWKVDAQTQFGTHKIKAVAFDNVNATGTCELNINVSNFLDQWVGNYQGVSEHWSSYPSMVNGQWQIINNSVTKNVSVSVSKNPSDTTLDLIILYENSNPEYKTNLNFNSSGTHNNSWGGGSSYGSNYYNFHSDSLKQTYFQKCGIPCNSGINYNIKKIN